MPDVDDFIAHPRTFMRNNVVMVVGPGQGGPGGVRRFSFTAAGGGTVARNMLNGGAHMPVFFLVTPSKNTGSPVDAYWCPYEPNNSLGTVLPGAGGPDFMFTYAMDGCTFVAGSVQVDHSVSVHHVNMGRSANLGPESTAPQRDENQRKMQRNIAKSLVTNPSLVEPDDYYDPNNANVVIPLGAKISTVTFGRRSTSGAWKFYTHQWYTVSGDRTTLNFIGTQRVI
ncbi:hypothetical protein [Plastoroseomonas arctica]|uniref:Uncharacterized protein n=1 Tax=Plastoroseomonas arctica TaxID=1509237 RepID=A0AAF1K3C7_9PROT|nr:hypothetical protein [Plastoroseomonas arctica]MBR0656013.1 hypothetical protein [Plastoroseomonas arctica]